MNDVITLDQNQDSLNKSGSTGLEFTNALDSDFLNSLAKNDSLNKLSLPLTMDAGINGEGGKHFKLSGKPQITIHGGLDSGIKLGFYPDAASLLEDLKIHEKLEVSLNDDTGDQQAFVLLSFNYTLQIDSNLKWVLGSGNFNFGAEVQRSRKLCIIRIVDLHTPLRKVIKETLAALKPPDKLQVANDLKPFTWLIIDTDASIRGELGFQLGYEFNWVRELQAGELSGDVGLHCKLGAQLGLGFDIAGQYALAIGRTQGDSLRVRLFKQKKKGWSFALALGASIKGNAAEVFTDKNLDELLKATLGMHHAQVLDDLREKLSQLDTISDPEKLEDALNGLGFNMLKKLFDSKAGETYEAVRKKALGILTKWKNLEQQSDELAATIWDHLEQLAPADISKLKGLIDDIATADSDSLQNLIETHITRTGFEKSRTGQIVLSLIPVDDVLDVLSNATLIKKLQTSAKSLSDVLALGPVLKNLHQIISEELNIEKIQQIADQAALDQVEPWLKGKISEAIDKNLGTITETELFKQIQEINVFVKNILKRRNELFEKTKKALLKEYNFNLALNYQKSRVNTALVDLEFNNLNSNNLLSHYRSVIDGDLNIVLTREIPGIKLHMGVLTQSVQRKKEIEINLPFLKRDFTEINKSLATATFVDEVDGRLMVFEVDAQSLMRKNRRLSQLLLEGKLSPGGKVPESMQLKYSFRMAKKNIRTEVLGAMLTPFVDKYLAHQFESTDKSPVNQWLLALAETIDVMEFNGKAKFGNALLNLEIRMPVTAMTNFSQAPADRSHDFYKKLSVVVQTALRRHISVYLFSNSDTFFKKVDLIDSVLVFQSLPIQQDLEFNKKDKITKWRNDRHLSAIKEVEAVGNLARAMGLMFSILSNSEQKDQIKAGSLHYNTLPEKECVSRIIANTNKDSLVSDFIKIEKEIVQQVVDSGIKLSSFAKNAKQDPRATLDALEDFGTIITRTFNKVRISGLSSRKDYTRYIGPMILGDILEFVGGQKIDTKASLELIAVRQKSFEPEQYINGELPASDSILIAERIFDFD